MKNTFAGLVLLFSASVVADDHAAVISQALENMSNDYHDEWAFTESETEDGVTTVGRFDPRLSQGERWTLLSVDGRQPTEEEFADYRHDRRHDFQSDDDDSDNEIEIIDIDTLELIEETDDYWLFSFSPDIGDDDEAARKFMKKVAGTVKVIRDGLYFEFIDMRNEKPIRPAFSVKISRFLTHLAFGPAAGNGPIVPLSVDVEVKGRAALVVKIDESESIRYTDYEYAGT
jgi:hypothetical protein